MVAIGIWLIFAGVVLRVVVRFAGLPQLTPALILLAVYGLALLAEPWLVEGRPLRLSTGRSAAADAPQPLAPPWGRWWLPAAYLLLQTGLIAAMLYLPPRIDHAAALFIPLSIQAVRFFGRRWSLVGIGVFALVMFLPLTGNEKGWPFALTMSLFMGGLCVLFGGYAHQVQQAESARSRNRQLLGELHVANRQLQGYAAQLEELAAEQERGRLARDLHDSVTQTVFSMNLTVQSARLLLAKDPGRTAAQLERLEQLAAGAMAEIQTLVSQLRPRPLAGEGLPAALRQLAAERQAHDGLAVTVDVVGQQALPEAVAAGLYGIAQEALANVVKHAGASQASIRLSLEQGQSWLEVADDGRGFDPQPALGQRGHLGLTGMAERAHEIGWTLSIDARPGAGACIRVAERPAGGPL